MSNNALKYLVLTGLFVIPFIPLVVSSSLFFPFITGKAFAFRLIVEIIFAAWLILAMRDESYRPKFSWILGAVFVFLIAIGIADVLSENPFKSFWSNYERMEGYVLLLHLGAFFLVAGSMLKTEQIWNRLLATSVGASAVMSVYSFFQLAGKIKINQGGVRVDGTFGNASYLGIYLVFHIFFAAILFSRFRGKWQRVLLGAVALMDIVVLYFTATRGAILGLLGGAFISLLFLAFKAEKGSGIRKLAGAGIIGLVLFAGIFFSVRNTSFVRGNPVLSRFASISLSEIRTQGRFYVWPMAVKGFVERPIFGWGQESFNFVFNKYYDPRMWNQEPWFDRAHNAPLDWLIAGGALGFLSYAAIYGALLLYIFRSKNESLSKNEKAAMLGLIAAYVFHNLFVFDQIGSYILFFIVIAYIHARSSETEFGFWNRISEKIRRLVESEKARPVFEASVLIFTVAIMYFVVYSPWRQNKALLEVLRINNEGKVGTLEEYTKPFSMGGMGLSESLEHISQTAISLSANPSAPAELKQGLFDSVDKAFQKQLERAPNDARYRLFYGLFLSRFGWYGRAVEQLKEAERLSPNKQQIHFELVSNLILDGKAAEASQIAKKSYELDPSYEEAGMVYGLSLIASGNSSSPEVFGKIPESKLIFDDRYITVLLSAGKFNEIVEVAKKRVQLEPQNPQHRITLTAAYLQAGRRQEAIKTLEDLIKLEPTFEEQGEYYINEIKAGRNP